MCHHARLIFIFLGTMGFHHLGQAGLELLTSGDLRASAFQSAGITGISHCVFFFLEMESRCVTQAGVQWCNLCSLHRGCRDRLHGDKLDLTGDPPASLRGAGDPVHVLEDGG